MRPFLLLKELQQNVRKNGSGRGWISMNVSHRTCTDVEGLVTVLLLAIPRNLTSSR